MSYPLWLDDIPNPKVLLVVAHPDDETIFAGGLILRSKNAEWTIVSCFPENPEREKEFREVCSFFGKESSNKIIPVILTNIKNNDSVLFSELSYYSNNYDITITHNYRGEYEGGTYDLSKYHIRVHRNVVESIGHPNTWFFISPGSSNVNQEELRSKLPNGNKEISLSKDILKLKKEAIKHYKSQLDGNLAFDLKSNMFLPPEPRRNHRHLYSILKYNFEEPGIEHFTFFDREIYEHIKKETTIN